MKSYNLTHDVPIQWTQYLSVWAGSLAILTSGMHYGWTSPSLQKMAAPDAEVHITSDEGSWIASSMLLGAFISCPMNSWLLKKFGRKTILLATSVPYLISWIMIIFANSAIIFCVIRFIEGMAWAMSFAVLPLYIGEISESDIRGSLGSAIPFMYSLGVLLAYSIGPFVSIRMFAIISSIVPVLLFITFIWAPESPYYLLSKNQTDLAKQNLQKLRIGKSIEKEFKDIQAAVKNQMEEKGNLLKLCFSQKSNRKALFIMMGVRTFHQLCGMTSFIFYAQKMFEEAGGALSSSTTAILYAFLQLVSSSMSTILLDRIGRKALLLISCVGSAICLAAEGFIFYRNDYNLLPDFNLTWLPMAGAFVYVVVSTMGLGVVPYVLVGELFPSNIKEIATCITIMYYDLISIIIIKLFQITADYLGVYVPFWIFMCSCVIGVFFVIFCIPETKGKSLEEIQNILKGKVVEEDKEEHVNNITEL